MRRIAHLSDLHFGTEDFQIAESLLADVNHRQPHLVVVSGDLTQRALESQFTAANAYLKRIPFPKLIVPGNHDIPLHDIWTRFVKPLDRYHRLISTDLHPFFHDDEIAVAGVNTARSNTWKEGRISLAQIETIRAQFDSVPNHLFKALVCHHPFIPPQGNLKSATVGRGSQALKMLERTGCALILSGHLHQSYSGDVRPFHLEVTRSILVAQAGTAISLRRRGESNGYNEITLNGGLLNLTVRMWDGHQFIEASARDFEHSERGWIARAV